LFYSPGICKLVACQRFTIPSQAPLIQIANQTAACNRVSRLAGMTERESLSRLAADSPEALHIWEFWKFSNKNACPFQESLAQALALCSERLTRTASLCAICASSEDASAFAIFCAFIRGKRAHASKETIASANSFKNGFAPG
jgi:hypothetical protein